jgi:hypothetical protein
MAQYCTSLTECCTKCILSQLYISGVGKKNRCDKVISFVMIKSCFVGLRAVNKKKIELCGCVAGTVVPQPLSSRSGGSSCTAPPRTITRAPELEPNANIRGGSSCTAPPRTITPRVPEPEPNARLT